MFRRGGNLENFFVFFSWGESFLGKFGAQVSNEKMGP